MGQEYEKINGKTLYGDVMCLNRLGEVLLVKRSTSDESNAGLWCLPGGHVDKGETAVTGALREFAEETNIGVDHSEVTLIDRKEDEKAYVFTYLYLLKEEDEPVLDAHEHFNYKWITKDELKESDLRLVYDLKQRLCEFMIERGKLIADEIGYFEQLGTNQVIAEPSPMEAFAIIQKGFDDGQVSEEVYFEALEKSKRGEQRKNKKYYKRLGEPGNYRYFYTEKDYLQYKGKIDEHEQIRQQAEKVINGEQHIERLSPEEEQGRIRGGKRAIEATLLLRGNEISYSTEFELIDGLISNQEIILENYARDVGVWMDYEDISNRDMYGGGEEAKVFNGNDGLNVLKVFDYKLFNVSPLDFIDNRVALHNHLFPDTQYELVGFTNRPDIGFSFVVKQQFVEGENTPVSVIKEEMKNLGFESVGGNTYQNENYVIDDLHKRNVFTDKEGLLRFIDTVPSLRDVTEGGGREYKDIKVLEKSFETLSKAFDQDLISEEQYLEALSKAKDLSHLTKKKVTVNRGGKVFQQTVYVNEDKDKQVETPVGGELSPSVKGLDIQKYSDKSILIKGDTYANLDLMRKIKKETGFGSFNKKLQGWVFGLNQLEKVLGLVWSDVVDKNEDKAKAIQNQKNSSLSKGGEVEVNGFKGEVEEQVSDSEGVKYNVKLVDGTILSNVDEKIINTKPNTNDIEISKTVGNTVPESRVNSKKKIYGVKPIDNIAQYSLEDYMKLHGLDEEDIRRAIKKLNTPAKIDSKKTTYSSATRKKKDKEEGLTKKQLISKLIYSHYNAVKDAIERGDNISDDVIKHYSDLVELYNNKKKELSEEHKRKISEALKKNKTELQAEEATKKLVDSLDKDKLNELSDVFQEYKNEKIKKAQKLLSDNIEKLSEINERRKSLFNKEKELREQGISTIDIFSERNDLAKSQRYLEQMNTVYTNRVDAAIKGGEIIEVSDQFGNNFEVGDFSNISSEFISFDENTILTETKPDYIPIIDEKSFSAGGFVLDSIKIGEDKYLVAVNRHRENRRGIEIDTGKEISDSKDIESSGYVALTLDQLVLTQEYYITKKKSEYLKEAEEKNQRNIDYWNNFSDEKKEKYYNQRNFYNLLPAKVKKKYSKDEWESLNLEEKQEVYIPIKRVRPRRVKYSFDDSIMPSSTHTLYERFINKGAKRKTHSGNEVEIDERGDYGNSEVFAYWKDISEMLQWKRNDLAVQREVQSDIRKKALETAYGDTNTNDVLKDKYGFLVKRQNGDNINPEEVEQIEKSWKDVQNSFGELKERANDFGLKISHSGEKNMFARKAIGLYVPDMRAIGVSAKHGEKQFGFTLGHEVAHWIDNSIGETQGKRFASDNYESTAGKIAVNFRRLMNRSTDSKYLNSTHECFARALEQYNAINNYGDGADRVDVSYFDSPEYVSKESFNKEVKPLIEKLLKDNKKLLKAFQTVSLAFDKGLVNEDQYLSALEKARQYQVGDVSEKTGLKKKAPGVWVDPKTGKEVKQDEEGERGKKKQEVKDLSDYSDKELEDYARNTPTNILQQVSEGGDERARVMAKKELLRREQEESFDEKKGEADKDDSKENKSKKEIKLDPVFVELNKKYKLSRLPVNIDKEDVQINEGGTKGNWILKWTDPKTGKNVSAYSNEFLKKNAKEKWNRIQNVSGEDIQAIKDKSKVLMASENITVSESAAIINIISNTGLRPGSKQGFNETKNRGVSTLAKENIKIDGDKVSFEFVGKSYKNNTAEIESPELAKYLKDKIKDKNDEDFIFDTDISNVREVFKSEVSTSDDMKLKDMRTYVATDMARKILFEDESTPPPLPDKGIKKAIQTKLKSVFKAVSDQLNNTPSMAKASYVHPNVINSWLETLGVREAEMYLIKSIDSDIKSLDDIKNNSDLDEEEDVDQYPLPEWWDESLE